MSLLLPEKARINYGATAGQCQPSSMDEGHQRTKGCAKVLLRKMLFDMSHDEAKILWEFRLNSFSNLTTPLHLILA